MVQSRSAASASRPARRTGGAGLRQQVEPSDTHDRVCPQADAEPASSKARERAVPWPWAALDNGQCATAQPSEQAALESAGSVRTAWMQSVARQHPVIAEPCDRRAAEQRGQRDPAATPGIGKGAGPVGEQLGLGADSAMCTAIGSRSA